MAPNSATFFSRAWYGDEEITLPLPEEWQVETLAPPQLPALTPAEIGSAFQRPIGSLPISQLARGSSSVAIVVDDLSRPTPAAVIIPATPMAQAKSLSVDFIRILRPPKRLNDD